MSDSMVNMMRRMEEIRSRIEEIRQLGQGKGLPVSPADAGKEEGATGAGASTAQASTAQASTAQATEFALLLQEASGLLEGEAGAEDGELSDIISQSLLGPLLGLNEDNSLSSLGGSGVESIKSLLQKAGAGESVNNLDEGLLSRAIEAYKKQND